MTSSTGSNHSILIVPVGSPHGQPSFPVLSARMLPEYGRILVYVTRVRRKSNTFADTTNNSLLLDVKLVKVGLEATGIGPKQSRSELTQPQPVHPQLAYI